MKKILSLILALALACTCLFTTLSAAEEASAPMQEEALTPEEQELAAAVEWLLQDVPEEEAGVVLTWDKETILSKLEGFDYPLEYKTKEEIAEDLAAVTDLFGSIAAAAEEVENGEGGEALLNLFAAFSGGEEGDSGMLSENLEGLLGTLLGGAFAGDDWGAGNDEDYDGYEIVTIFNGTFWENDSLSLEIVWQDGYYKAVVSENGEEKWFYLCENGDYVDEAAEAEFSCLNGIGTGDEETTASQEDHGETTFIYDWRTDEMIWKQKDGTETVFAHVTDPLDQTKWFGDGKELTLTWLGGSDYEAAIEGSMGEFTSWDYQCVLDEAADVLSGTGSRTSYGAEEYSDSHATFALQNSRRQMVWTDEKEEAAAEGLVLDAVATEITAPIWYTEPYTAFIEFADGYYDIVISREEEMHGYLCTWDWETATFTAVDPAEIPYDSLRIYVDPEIHTGTGTFVLEDEDHLIWRDDSGLTGDGIALERM